MASGSPRAGQGGAAPLTVSEFVGSIARLEWAKDNGCPWESETCEQIAAGGQLCCSGRESMAVSGTW